MANANTDLFDALVRHQIGLLQLAGSVRNGINEILDDTEDDIEAAIRKRLANMGDGTRTSAEIRRMQTLLDIVKRIRLQAWDELTPQWMEAMYDIAKAESESFVRTLKTTSPATLDLLLPSVAKLKAIVNTDMFEGRVLKEWIAKLKQDDLIRIQSAIQQGVIQGEGVDQIVRRVMHPDNGMTQLTRNQADSITRTAINNIANEVRTQVALDNEDIIPGEIFVATLDARTTPICRANDGKVFAVGKGPKPPLHFRCRSLRIATFSGSALGNRPAKASTEKGLIREFNEANGTEASSRDDLPHGMKGKYDDFARKRIRELTGQVEAHTTYQDWLTTQSKDFQKDVLGETRARLFRDGKLKLDRFVNRNGDEITLHELAQREAKAFRDAGLDPDNF